MWQWTSSCVPQIPLLVGGLILTEAILTLCLDACPSVEVFVTCSRLGPGRPQSLPLVGGVYHAQRTLIARASKNCPSLEDFVLYSGLQPWGPQELPLTGGLCHAQQTSTTNGLRNCPLLEDLISRSVLWPQRASRNCPLLEDFVSHSGLWPLGPQELPLVRGLCHVQQTLTTRVSGVTPHWRTLSCTVDFDHEGPTFIQMSLKDKWRTPPTTSQKHDQS